MRFAEWVKQARRDRKFTQEECAQRAGVEQPVWANYEDAKANRQPRRDTIAKIAVGLGLPESEVRAAVINCMDAPREHP